MKRKPNQSLLKAVAAFCLLLVVVAGCKKEPIIYETSDEVNITTYIDRHPDQFSEWRKILELTGTAGFLQAYGNYTHFLPTNDAVALFLKDRGKTSSDQIDLQELKDIVKFHVLEDTISTQKFTDGKLPVVTMLNQYLTTGAANTATGSSITINRQAKLIKGDLPAGNGRIHIIDHVLLPAKLTLAQLIQANPEYSLFTEALKETGLFDTLNIINNPDAKKKFLTVLAESNTVLKAANLNTLAQLKSKYSPNATDYKNFTNGLHQFVDYHILTEAKYLADIVSAKSHITLAAPEIVLSTLEGENVLINDVIFNGVYEPGIKLDRSTSDFSAVNGVLHATAPYKPAATAATTGHYDITARVPYRVDWDVADFPEIRSQRAIFRKANGPEFIKLPGAQSPIAGWDWPGDNTIGTPGHGVTYRFATGYVNSDFLLMWIGITNRNAWIEMKTPVIVRGKYRVWICWRRQLQSGTWPTGSRTQCRTVVDGVALAKPFDFCEPIPTGSIAERESLGWKSYTVARDANYIAKDVGVIDIKTTDIHSLRLEVILNSQSANNLDMIQFIPVTDNQILPRFRQDGTLDFTP